MKLNELQHLWDEASQQQTENSMSKKMIQQFIDLQSQSLLSEIEQSLRKKIWWAAFIGVLVCVVAPVFLFDPEDFLLDNLLSPLEMSVMTLMMGLIVLFVAYRSWCSKKEVRSLQSNTDDVGTTLKVTAQLLERLQNLKIRSDAIGIPFFGTWMAYGYFSKQTSLGLGATLLLLLLVGGALVWLGHHSAHWANKYYQPYIDRLNSYQKELLR